jgi:hypothetical protein
MAHDRSCSMKTGDRVAAYTQQNEGAPLTPQQLRRVKQKAWRDQDEHNVVGRTVLQWKFYREPPAVMAPEWVTVLTVRPEADVVRAIVVCEDGTQDMISYKGNLAVRIQVPVVTEDAS